MRRSSALLVVVAFALAACGNSSIPPAATSESATAASSTSAMTPSAATTSELSVVPSSAEASGTASMEPSGLIPPPSQPSVVPATETVVTEVPAPTGVTITTAVSDYGEVLFDATGQAIYLFDKEATSEPDCYDDCAIAWPPVLTEGAPVAAGGTSADLLGTTARSDGSMQVTYAGHPLYFYAHEGKNMVTCHDVLEFGGLWLAVAPSGQPAAT